MVAFCARLVVGVPLFFVISGYCIAATADATRERSGSVRGYFARRFRRIFPPYWAVLGITLICAAIVERALAPGLVSGDFGPIASIPDPFTLSPTHWVGSLTLTETWRHSSIPGVLQRFFSAPRGLCATRNNFTPSRDYCYFSPGGGSSPAASS